MSTSKGHGGKDKLHSRLALWGPQAHPCLLRSPLGQGSDREREKGSRSFTHEGVPEKNPRAQSQPRWGLLYRRARPVQRLR